ncbi:MAG: hypothetical protein AB2598_15970 [Candidatus Thiodiazotropha sp.]
MDDDVYRTPNAVLTDQQQPRGSAVRAVLLASALDIIATLLVGIVISLVYGMILASNGDSLEVITLKLSEMELTSRVSMAAILSGCIITTYAGYLCAKIANFAEYRVVAGLAVVVIVFGIAMGQSYYSFSENLVLSLLSLCCVYFGAWLYVGKKKRSSNDGC